MKIHTNYKIAGESFELETTLDFGVVRGIKASGRAIAQGAKSTGNGVRHGLVWAYNKAWFAVHRKGATEAPSGQVINPGVV